MKTLNKILFAAALTATFSLANRAGAQYKPVGDDGISASPKVRQMLNERKSAPSTTSTVASSFSPQAGANDGIAASPKLRRTLNERKTVASTPSTSVASVGYKPVGDDGIVASPKLRQQLNARSTQFMVAPLK